MVKLYFTLLNFNPCYILHPVINFAIISSSNTWKDQFSVNNFHHSKKNPLTILRKSVKSSLFELRKSVNNFNQSPKKIITKLPSQNGNHTSTNNYMKNLSHGMEKITRHTLNKSSIMTSITNSFFKLMPNLRSTPNTIFYLSNNLCKITWNLHPLWIQKLPMDVSPKTLLFFFTHKHSLHFFYLFIYFFITMLNVHCNFSYFLLCGMLLYSVVSRCKTLPLYFYFYFLFSSSFLCFATLILISQTLFHLCTLRKPLRENPNILVFLLVLPPMQKILSSSLGFTQFFLLSP